MDSNYMKKIKKLRAIINSDDNYISMKDLLLILYEEMNEIKENTDGMNADDFIRDFIKEIKCLDWKSENKK